MRLRPRGPRLSTQVAHSKSNPQGSAESGRAYIQTRTATADPVQKLLSKGRVQISMMLRWAGSQRGERGDQAGRRSALGCPVQRTCLAFARDDCLRGIAEACRPAACAQCQRGASFGGGLLCETEATMIRCPICNAESSELM